MMNNVSSNVCFSGFPAIKGPKPAKKAEKILTSTLGQKITDVNVEILKRLYKPVTLSPENSKALSEAYRKIFTLHDAITAPFERLIQRILSSFLK